MNTIHQPSYRALYRSLLPCLAKDWSLVITAPGLRGSNFFRIHLHTTAYVFQHKHEECFNRLEK
jgi:hypothetical protein